jgi:hypothetical protein
MRYDVHLYVTVRVKVPDIEAANQLEAIEVAESRFFEDCNQLARQGEYADEITAALVDEQGDRDYENSRLHLPDPDVGWKVSV